MSTFTIAQMQAAGIQPAAVDIPGLPKRFMLEYLLDAAKKVIATADIIEVFQLPDLSGCVIDGASLETLTPGTASGTMDLQLVTTDVTGLTGWATDAAAGTKLVKLATAANTVVNAGAASAIRWQQNTAGCGGGKWKLRVWGLLMSA